MSRETEKSRSRRLLLLLVLCCLWTAVACSVAFGQDGPPPHDGPGNGPPGAMGPPPMEHRRPPMERALHMGPHGRWWNDPAFVKMLSLSADQQKRMEDIFEQNRPKLMDLSNELKTQETTMTPLLEADQPDEGKVLAQIDQIAQARAQLEKANARMLLGLRRVLTQDQWKKLQANDPGRNDQGRNEYGPHSHHESGPDKN
jgi:Spy/CpxP family protein refolding chaperone